MASMLLDRFRTDHDPEKPKKKVPKVAFYVLGAAFTLSTGLTILILPYVRQAARLASAPPPIAAAPARNLRPLASSSSAAGAAAALEDTALRNTSRWTSDEFKLYGPGGKTAGSPSMGNMLWMGIKALGIATGFVGAGAAVGVVATARMMGVTTMNEFASKMRETVASNMPELADISRAAQLESTLDEHGKPRAASRHDFLDEPDDRPS